MTHSLLAAVLALPLLVSPVDAQRPGNARPQAPARPAGSDSISLVYEREIFTYRGMDRRDPFRPLTNEDQGPRFETLSLQGIIYSTGRGRSVALLGDVDGRIYRVRVGDSLGNVRIVEIGPLRVVFAVEDFGNVRQEMLELKKREGANP